MQGLCIQAEVGYVYNESMPQTEKLESVDASSCK
jgi:hypothetical protein